MNGTFFRDTYSGTSPQNREFWKNEPIEFKGNKVYQRDDLFDPNLMTTWRDKGKIFRGTNIERMATGRAPVGYDGNAVNLRKLTLAPYITNSKWTNCRNEPDIS